MNKNFQDILDSAAGLHIPDDLDLFPRVKAKLDQRRTFMQTLRARPALALMLAILALILLTGVAYAIGRSLGYIPGVGLVERGVQLRVLAEPVSLTREAVTVTIEQVVVDSERMVVIYKTEGLTIAAANSKGELGAPLPSLHSLRLPDGTLLQEDPALGYNGTPEPLINDLKTEGGWPNYVRRLVFPSVDPQVDKLKLIIPLLDNMPVGAAPENWEIPFHLKPAPAEMTLVPILELTSHAEPALTGTPLAESTTAAPLSNVSTHNGVTLSLDNVIEVENGFVFTGKLTWDQASIPPNRGLFINLPEFLMLSDGNGQKIPIEPVELNAAYDAEHQRLWSFRTNRKNFTGPLVFSISSLKWMYTPPAYEFDFDLGPNPQVGQTWDISRDLVLDGHTIQLDSARLYEPYNGCTLYGLEFQFKGDMDNIFTQVMDKNPIPPGDYSCESVKDEGGRSTDPTVIFTTLLYKNIPNGLRHFSLVTNLPHTLEGPWQVAWEPPAASEAIPTPAPEACLTIEKWDQVINQHDSLPPELGGKVVTAVTEGGNFSAIYISSPDGVHSQRIVAGGESALSKDGTRLVYIAEDGLHLVDLASGQNTALGIEGYQPKWSPDGTRILYTTFSNLYVINADGSGVQTINTDSTEVNVPAGWLPDNQTIIYSIKGGTGFNYKSHNLQSGKIKDLFVANSKEGSGYISPDGQWIVFRDRIFGAMAPGTFIWRTDGSERRLIVAPEVGGARLAAWSPDGQWLVFDASTYGRTNAFHVLVNPFTCQVLHVDTIHGMVEDWVP